MKKTLLPFFLVSILSQPNYSQQTVGLFLNDSLSVNGYTLFSNNRITYLIDNCGFVVNTWESNFNSNTGLYLLENGNLLRSSRITGAFVGGGIGGRVELFDWEGDLLWAHNYAGPDFHQHHDIEPLPNGNFLILAWEAKTKEEAIQAGRNPGFVSNNGVWPERIVEVEMVGTNEIDTIWEWHLWDHLVQDFDSLMDNHGVISEHPELVDLNFGTLPGNIPNGGEDWIHANSIDYHPGLDQIVISSRHFSEIWIIDHSTSTEEAAGHTGGEWGKGGDLLYRWGNPQIYDRGSEADRTLWGQHNVNWILEESHPHFGKLLVYNNGFQRPGGNYSSVDIWTPPTDLDGQYIIEISTPFGPTQPDWTFIEPNFFAPNVSGVHSLPGGNLFVCEGTEGRFFEITLGGQTVWEYINPVSSISGPINQGQLPSQNTTFRATRYPADYPAFEGKDLTPGNPIELNPSPSDCIIFDGPPVSTAGETAWQGAWLRGNPVQDEMIIINETGLVVHVEIFDMTGKKLDETKSPGLKIYLKTSSWPNGFYVLRISDEKQAQYFAQKFVKN